jgi:hypothetical protein
MGKAAHPLGAEPGGSTSPVVKTLLRANHRRCPDTHTEPIQQAQHPSSTLQPPPARPPIHCQQSCRGVVGALCALAWRLRPSRGPRNLWQPGQSRACETVMVCDGWFVKEGLQNLCTNLSLAPLDAASVLNGNPSCTKRCRNSTIAKQCKTPCPVKEAGPRFLAGLKNPRSAWFGRGAAQRNLAGVRGRWRVRGPGLGGVGQATRPSGLQTCPNVCPGRIWRERLA